MSSSEDAEQQKGQEQLPSKQQPPAETAGQNRHAGQMGSNNHADESSERGYGGSEHKSSNSQLMDNGHAELASSQPAPQPPGGSRLSELSDGLQLQGKSGQQHASLSPFANGASENRICKSEQSQPTGESGIGKEAEGRASEAPHHQHYDNVGNGGLGERLGREGSGECDSFTSARSDPGAAAQMLTGADTDGSSAAANHTEPARGQQSKQPSLLPPTLVSSTQKPDSSANGSVTVQRKSRSQLSTEQAKQGVSLLDFFTASSKEPDPQSGRKASAHVNGNPQ